MGHRKNKRKNDNEKRRFVLCASILLLDPRAIFNFDEHDIIIPYIVAEEVAKFNKDGDDVIHTNAREFIRILSELIEKNGCTSTSQIPLGDGKGTLTIEEWVPTDLDLASSISPVKNNDNLIIAAAQRHLDEGDEVTIVSKNAMLRIKALNRKINAEDYTHDLIKNAWALETDITRIDSSEICETNPNNSYYINQPLVTDVAPDSIYIWNGSKPILVEPTIYSIGGVKIVPRGREQRFAMHVLSDPKIKTVAITGAAGSGKTLLAIAAALELMKKGLYSKIYVSRIPVALGDEKVGALPGDVDAKNDLYFASIRDACRVLMGSKGRSCSEDQVKAWMEEKSIESVHMSYIRGRTLNNAIVILDEAQNTDTLEIKTYLTRPTDSCKIILAGDINQIDRRWISRESNGLSKVISVGVGQGFFARAHLPLSQRGIVARFFDEAL